MVINVSDREELKNIVQETVKEFLRDIFKQAREEFEKEYKTALQKEDLVEAIVIKFFEKVCERIQELIEKE